MHLRVPVAAHPAGQPSLIAVERSLVVPGLWGDDEVLAIAESLEARLFALDPLLDHHAAPRVDVAEESDHLLFRGEVAPPDPDTGAAGGGVWLDHRLPHIPGEPPGTGPPRRPRSCTPSGRRRRSAGSRPRRSRRRADAGRPCFAPPRAPCRRRASGPCSPARGRPPPAVTKSSVSVSPKRILLLYLRAKAATLGRSRSGAT